MSEQPHFRTGEEQASAWQRDRETESAPLPYANQPKYTNDSQRQVDLAAVERANIARAAGELGLTAEEWRAKRAELGRSPCRGDIV